MADWTAPFHRPKMTTPEFVEMKKKFVAEHGYYITVPGLSDIIHLGIETTMTPEEERLWRAREYNKIEPWRIHDIRKMKQKRKDKFLSMLASPTPHIVNNAGSIMTSIDDAQDALSTLAFIGKIVLTAAPRALAKVLSGPVGWLMTAAETLNLVQHLGFQRLGPLPGKRLKDAATKSNPKSKMYKIKKALKAKGIWPSQGVILEALQVSDNVFGVGICLGPIVGYLIESVTGPMRRITGQPCKVKLPWESMSEITAKAQKASRSQLAYVGAGLQTDPDEVVMMAMANYLSQQELLTHASSQNAFDNIEDFNNVELRAPEPDNILTREVIAEEGILIDDVVGWPHSDRKWVRTADIGPEYYAPTKQFQRDFMAQHNNDWYGYAYGGLTTEATAHVFTTTEGEGNLEYDYTPLSKWAHIMLDHSLVLKEGQPESKTQLLLEEMQRLEDTMENPTLRGIIDFCNRNQIILESVYESEPTPP